jgi:hypothetical protein
MMSPKVGDHVLVRTQGTYGAIGEIVKVGPKRAYVQRENYGTYNERTTIRIVRISDLQPVKCRRYQWTEGDNILERW